MEILLTLVTVMTVFNTLLTIGIAGSVSKLIKSLNNEEDHDGERVKWAQIIRQRRRLQLQEGNPASYADHALMGPAQPEEEVGPRGWDGVSRRPGNWDGIPKPRE